MKIYQVCLALLIFNLCLSYVYSSGMVPGGAINPGLGPYSTENLASQASGIESMINQSDSGTMGDINELVVSVKLLISALPAVFQMLIYSTVGFPILLSNLSCPIEIIAIATPIVYFLFLFGMFELLTGRAFQD